jgi:PDZ domain-containing protein
MTEPPPTEPIVPDPPAPGEFAAAAALPSERLDADPEPPDTADGGDSNEPPVKRRFKRRRAVGITLAVILVGVGVAGSIITKPVRIISPGDATPVGHVVHVAGAPTYSPKGDVLFLTVSITNGQPNLWRYYAAELDGDDDIVPEQAILGGQTNAENDKIGVEEMVQSQQDARIAALRWLGYKVPITGTGAIVSGLYKGSPAAAAFKVGDVITAINGTQVTTIDGLGPIIKGHPVGTPFTIDFDRGSTHKTAIVKSASLQPQNGVSGPAIGVAVITQNERIHYPVKITVDVGPVSGPSAGLAFTLAIIDEMTAGNLTGGQKIAVTGTMDRDGNVGPVGGARQKAIAAHSAGAKFMLVPPDEVKDAKKGAGSMPVIPVTTLDEAIKVLEQHGGAAVKPHLAADVAA